MSSRVTSSSTAVPVRRARSRRGRGAAPAESPADRARRRRRLPTRVSRSDAVDGEQPVRRKAQARALWRAAAADRRAPPSPCSGPARSRTPRAPRAAGSLPRARPASRARDRCDDARRPDRRRRQARAIVSCGAFVAPSSRMSPTVGSNRRIAADRHDRAAPIGEPATQRLDDREHAAEQLPRLPVADRRRSAASRLLQMRGRRSGLPAAGVAARAQVRDAEDRVMAVERDALRRASARGRRRRDRAAAASRLARRMAARPSAAMPRRWAGARAGSEAAAAPRSRSGRRTRRPGIDVRAPPPVSSRDSSGSPRSSAMSARWRSPVARACGVGALRLRMAVTQFRAQEPAPRGSPQVRAGTRRTATRRARTRPPTAKVDSCLTRSSPWHAGQSALSAPAHERLEPMIAARAAILEDRHDPKV